jgi:hypothetical protein
VRGTGIKVGIKLCDSIILVLGEFLSGISDRFNLCRYKDIFGVPSQGLHRYRLFDLAIVDVVLTFIGAYALSYFAQIRFYYVLGILVVTGILLHRLFCVRTKVDRILDPIFGTHNEIRDSSKK